MRNYRMKVATVAVIMALTCSGCRKPYDKPELVTIQASQTAFLIPLVGNTENQASFESEELLAKAKVATKQIQIPHRWVQTGRKNWQGEWIPAASLIVVERTPETREWSADANVGTSKKNQAIYAESKESIGFSVGMNCSAQIYTEDDAIKFLYSYNNKSLADIMDTEVRARVESKFVETCAKYSMNDILEKKAEIMNTVRDDVTTYFNEKGITITVLGMKDGVEYNSKEIQKAIDEKFSSEQKMTVQENENKVAISKIEAEKKQAILKAEAEAESQKLRAEAEANAILIKAQAEAEANKKLSESLTEMLIEMKRVEQWNGEYPHVMTDGKSSLVIPVE